MKQEPTWKKDQREFFEGQIGHRTFKKGTLILICGFSVVSGDVISSPLSEVCCTLSGTGSTLGSEGFEEQHPGEW